MPLTVEEREIAARRAESWRGDTTTWLDLGPAEDHIGLLAACHLLREDPARWEAG